MSSFNMSNGALRGSFGGYDGQNDYGSNMSYQDEYKPQIYRVRLSINYNAHVLLR